MEELTNIALSKAQTLLEKVKIYEIRIQSYIQQHQKLNAIETALEVLNLLGIKLSKHPTNLDIFLGWLETKLALHNKQTDELLNLPKMSAPNQLAAMRIMYSVCILADSTTNKLCLLLPLKMIALSVKYGNTGISAFAYANYGVMLCESWNQVELGYQFGKLALILLDDFNIKELKNRVFFVVNTRIKPWRQHFHKSLNFFLKAYRQGIKSLDFEAAVYAIFSYFYSAYYIGEELGYLEQEIAKYNETISKFGQEIIIDLNRLYQQVILNLMDKGKYRWQLLGNDINEQTMVLHYQETNNRVAIYHLYFNRLILSYLFEEYDRAVESAVLAEKYLDSVTGTIVFYGFFFYTSLAQLARCNHGQKNYQNRAIVAQVQANQQKLKFWAENSPINYLHKFYLVEAELSSILNQNTKAIDYYDRAIELAKEHKYIHEAALANELAAKFYLVKGNARLAQPYLLNARYCYYRWGAIAKVNQLEDKYSQLLESKFFKNK
jgi:predicted ATPase